MNQLALQEGAKYLIKNYDFSSTPKLILEDLVEFKPTQIVLEIGFGSGENLLKSAKMNPDVLYLGADPFLNTNAKCIKAILNYNIKNIMIWPDDIRKIIEFFPSNIFSEIKILFPDPWPKFKHKNRRLVQDNFLISLYNVLKTNGIIKMKAKKSMWVMNLSYWGFNQYIIQRALAAKSVKEAQKGIVFAAFLKLLITYYKFFDHPVFDKKNPILLGLIGLTGKQ